MSALPDNNQTTTSAAAPASSKPDAQTQNVIGPELERPAVAPSDPEKDDMAAWLDTFADAPDDDAHSPPNASPPPANATPEWEPRVFAAPLSEAQHDAWREVARRERYEPWLTEIFAKMATVQPLSDAERRGLRLYSDILALWALCEEPACRRERTCRGREPLCFGAVGDLVPVCALSFLAGFVAGQMERLPFDAMLAQLPEGAAQHWAVWHAAVAQIVARPRARHNNGEAARSSP